MRVIQIAWLALAAVILSGGIESVPCCRAAEPAEAVPKDRLVKDWILQDHGNETGRCFTGGEHAKVEVRMIETVLEELSPDAARSLRSEMDRLAGKKTPGNDPRWKALYVKACEQRRVLRLRTVVEKSPTIVFTKHYDIGGSHYAYTEGLSDAMGERHFKPGTQLCLWNADGPYGSVRTLIDDRDGVIRDPDVSHDGKRILFAWKKSDREDDYHLYEMDVATEEIKQLTFGRGYADYEGQYLPNGDIIFNSSRCGQSVDCNSPEVSNLYTCNANGKFMRRLSVDQVHTNYPTVTDDGRVIYTRWDYNDRSQLFPQPLFQMNPDGSNQTELYGNNSWFPTTIMHARGVPGGNQIVAVLSGHHSRQRGKLAIIDTRLGRQEADGVQLIAPVRETKPKRIDTYGQEGEQFQYPYPLSDTEFLVTYATTGGNNRKNGDPFGIYYMTIDGRRELLAWDPKVSSNQPVPLVSRRTPHIRPRSSDYRQEEAVFYLHDIYRGPGLAGVARGTIKALRVVKLEFRPTSIRQNYARGPGGSGHPATPVSIGSGTWDVKVVLGDATVYEDGSACFTVPARTPVYFQAIDAKGHAVQTMRSWSTLQPGETLGCVGCHESKHAAPGYITGTTQAQQKGPEELKPFYGPPRGFSFIREVQPILDRHCIECHKDRTKKLMVFGVPVDDDALDPAQMQTILAPESEWRYWVDWPPSGWEGPDLDDSAWKVGKGGFGKADTSCGTIHTQWTNWNIWMRRTLELAEVPEDRQLLLWLSFDDDVTVFFNGVLACQAGGRTGGFRAIAPRPEAVDALKVGPNTFAVHCRHGSGGQFIDVALITVEASNDPPTPTKVAFSLLGKQTPEGSSGRAWSDSYLALTQPRLLTVFLSGRPNPLVRWFNAQSAPPMLKPYSAGAAKSRLLTMLEEGHNDVKLSRQEMDKIACWIDLAVPYCGDYLEANIWNEDELEKYDYYLKKRRRMETFDADNITSLISEEGF